MNFRDNNWGWQLRFKSKTLEWSDTLGGDNNSLRWKLDLRRAKARVRDKLRIRVRLTNIIGGRAQAAISERNFFSVFNRHAIAGTMSRPF